MKRLVTPYRVVVSVLISAAVAMILVGFISSVDPSEESTARDQRVVQVLPEPNDAALRQSRIFARLADNYSGVLVVDGYEIPDDQIDRSEGANTVAYTPGEGTETGELKPGQRCATVIFWPDASTRAASAQRYTWCWQVH